MHILVAPDKFKDCLSAPAVAQAIAAGIRGVGREITIDQCPLADGGEGTVEALLAAGNGVRITLRVTGPLPDMKVDAAFALLPDQTAVIEMSAASGLALLKAQDRDPFRTTTYGTGELLLEAARRGARKIILGIGGSATIDGGIGCCQACGLPVILDEQGPADPREPLVGEDLRRVVLVKHARGGALDRIPIEVASDVTSPLHGPTGAARVFGRQKGASDAQVEELDRLLEQLARKSNAIDVAARPGAGAAGGLGFAMMAFFNAVLRPGFDIVAEAVRFQERLGEADLVITGEGRLDASSLHGKVPVSVARLCRQMDIPCIAIAGTVDESVDWREHFAATCPLAPAGGDVAGAMSRGIELLESTARKIMKERA